MESRWDSERGSVTRSNAHTMGGRYKILHAASLFTVLRLTESRSGNPGVWRTCRAGSSRRNLMKTEALAKADEMN